MPGAGPRPGPPPRRQTLTFPDDVASPPTGLLSAGQPPKRGMSGRFLSGDKPQGRSTGGNANRGVPPKRSPMPPQAFQPLTMDNGPFDLYGAMDSPLAAGSPLSMPKPSPVPKRTPQGRTAPKPLKSLDKNGMKSKKLPSAKPDIASQYDRMLTGYLDNLPAPQSSTVRIFLSSTFSDFKAERNYLIKNAYPQLREYCQYRGLDFQVVDLRWGISDNSTNDHTVEALCLNEITNCQRFSPGPNFIAMLGNRYGFCPVPTSIPSDEFETLRRLATDANLLTTWYKKDDNAVPPAYILQNISTHIPDYDGEDEAKRKEARATWQNTMQQLQQALQSAAGNAYTQNAIDEKRLHEYNWSVTEQEIQKGLLGSSYPEASCLAFFRGFKDINFSHKTACRFQETKTSGDDIGPDMDRVTAMESQKKSIKKKLTTDNRRSYNIMWKDGGVLPDDPEHGTYLQSLCDDVVATVKGLVDEQVTRDQEQRRKQVTHVVSIPKPTPDVKPSQDKKGKGRGKQQVPFAGAFGGDTMASMMRGKMAMQGIIDDHKSIEKGDMLNTEAQLKIQLHADILHHLTFCKKRCTDFCGRRDELERVCQYVTSQEESPPLVVTSPAGGGKTSFMAKVAEMSRTWLGEHTVVIARFLGTSPSSSALLPLLGSICSHISMAYGEPLQPNTLNHIGAVQKYLMDLLMLVSLVHGQRRPLVILLDSIEGLSLVDNPHLLHWLPKHIPTYIKIIISITPEVNNGLEHACAHLQIDDTFLNLHLQPLTAEDAAELISLYPHQRQRVFSEKQKNKLLMKAETLPDPLLLKLWLDEACLWKSYTTELILPGTTNEAVQVIFDRLEQKFGKVFVSAALGYLTICLDGISEVELENALSANDEVMNEVYKYHNPPLEGIVRIPSLMWKRMYHDLQQYIVENQTPDRTILSWYHRQFGQVAEERYAKGKAGLQLHADLAKIFLVEDKLCSTIVLSQRKLTIKDADRLVNPQVLKPSNRRKMLTVCYHLSKSGDADTFKHEVLCNLRFLQCLYRGIFSRCHHVHAAAQIWQILSDIDEESTLVVSALRLINPLIRQDLHLLPVQLLNQLVPYAQHYQHIAALCKQAEDSVRSSKKATLLPLIGNVENESSPVSWYFEGPTRIINQSQDGSILLLGYKSRNRNGPLCSIFDVHSSHVTHTIWKTKSLERDTLYSGALSRNNRRAYLLCKDNYVVYSILDGGHSKVYAASNNVNGAGSLHECMVASRNDKMLVLAGPARIAMFEDKSNIFDDPEFRVRRAMNFAGAKATTNIIFTDDETGSISSHTIQGKKHTSGAIARWTFDSQDPCEKLGLPEPIPPGCLQRLPGMSQPDCVLVACNDGKLYIICMSSGTRLLEIRNSVGLRGKSLLLDLHPDGKVAAVGSREQTTVALFDLTEEKMTGHVEITQNAHALRLGPDKNHLTVLRRDGILKLYQVDGLKEVASVSAHIEDATSLFCPDDGHILTCAYDKTLKQFELNRLIGKTNCSPISNEQALKRIEYTDVDNFSVVDPTTIITGHRDASPRLWSVESGQELKTLEPANLGSGVTCIAAKSTRVMSLDQPSKTVKQWEWPSAKPVKLLPGIKDVLCMTASVDGELVVFVCEHTPGTMIFVYSPEKHEETCRIFITEKIPKMARAYLTKNARYLICLMEKFEKDEDDKEVRIPGVVTVDLSKPGDQDSSWLEREVQTLATLDSELFVLGGEGQVVVWQPPKTVGLFNMKNHGNWLKHATLCTSKKGNQDDDVMVTCLATSPNDRQLVTAAENGTLALWHNVLKKDLADQTKGILLKKHSNAVTCIMFSPDGNYLASGSTDKTLVIWDPSSGAAIAQMHTHARVHSIDFFPDGKKVISLLKGQGSSRLGVWTLVGNVE